MDEDKNFRLFRDVISNVQGQWRNIDRPVTSFLTDDRSMAEKKTHYSSTIYWIYWHTLR